MSDVFPTTPDDERDPREDQNADAAREAEIKCDRPPHHGGEGLLLSGSWLWS